MRFCAITEKGIEKVTALEINEIIKAEGEVKIEESVVIFDASIDDAIKFCYKSQSIDRLMLLFDSFNFKNKEDLLEKAANSIKKEQLAEWFKEDKSFRVSCEKKGYLDFTCQEIEMELGDTVFEKIKALLGFEPKVNLKTPDVMFFVFLAEEQAYLGIDFTGRDLSKRAYRIFTNPGTINAKLAYAMVRLSGYQKKQRMVDIMSKSGLVPIEAALFASGVPVNRYSKDFLFKKLFDKDWDELFKKIDASAKDEKLDITGLDPILRNLEAAKKNAKLAGIDKLITFTKIDLDWLDIKLDKKSVDLVVSRIQCPSNNVAENTIRKSYKELFYQCEFFMKNKARLCVLSENLNLLKEMMTANFKLVSEDELWSGQQRYEFAVIEKAETGSKEITSVKQKKINEEIKE
jgi:23S rRNA G2445 N2-methylase RlmL